MDRDQLTLLDRLAPLDLHLTDHPTHPLSEPTLSEPALLGRMSLLDRMNIRHCEINSRLSSPSIGTKNCQSPELSQELVSSSTTMLPSPTLKRKRPLTFTSKSSTPLTLGETLDSSHLVRKRTRQWTSLSTRSSTKSLTKPDLEMTSRTTLMTSMSPCEKGEELESATWDGITLTTPPPSPRTTAAGRPANASRPTTKTSLAPNSLRSSTGMHPLVSLPLNGTVSSEEKRSTSTTSCLLFTGLQLMKRERLALETQKSALEYLTRKGVSVPPLNGPLLGIWRPGQSHSLSPTVLKNCGTTAILSRLNSPANSPARTQGSSSSTSLLGILCRAGRSPSSPTGPFTSASIPLSSCQTELPPALLRVLIDDRANHVHPEVNRMYATVSTRRTGVLPQIPTAMATGSDQLGFSGINRRLA